MRYTIDNGILRVTADTLGAELVSVICGGKERLWQNENGSWRGHAPVLFPVCGHCGVKLNGTEYPVPPHGFIKNRELRLEERGRDRLVFSLPSNGETEEIYPYPFVFKVVYALDCNFVEIKYEVANPSDGDLYFSCGGHDSFALDGDVGEYKLVFEQEENFLHLCHDGEGLLTGETQNFGSGRELFLPADYLQNGRTLIFGGINSRAVTLAKAAGEAVAEVRFQGFSNLLLWRPHGAHMICIEPWCNLPDGANGPQTEFPFKKGVLKVAPHCTKTLVRSIRYFE